MNNLIPIPDLPDLCDTCQKARSEADPFKQPGSYTVQQDSNGSWGYTFTPMEGNE